jgi:hypothetical protein
MTDEKKVLWICPKCDEENTELSYCLGCKKFWGLRLAVNRAVDQRKSEIHTAYLCWIGTFCFIALLVWGFGYGGFSAVVSSVSPTATASPTPSPTPTPTPVPAPTLSADVKRAAALYAHTNWKGWSLSYDEETSYVDDKSGWVSVYLEKDGHRFAASWDVMLLTTGDACAWTVVPASAETSQE